ncbi:MAG: flagellar hook basal-body protein [Acidobacteria bacterium]|nr:flagellar hook basal-body protein [Acidobacteriota bacterium]
MDPLLISAASGMKSRMESLDMLANNVSNSGTAGFKSDREFYNLYVSQEAVDATDEWRPDPTTSPVVERHWTDFGQGTLLSTGNALDLAIAGKGFFVVDTANGPLYTRNGNFRLSPKGQVITQDGQTVRVLRPDGEPATLDTTAAINVDAKGVIHQNGQAVATLVTAEMEDNAKLMKQGSTYFRIDGPNPKLSISGEVHQGTLESSNVPVAEAAVKLVNVMRQFEMLQRAASIGNDMNKQLIDQVAKVS